MPGTFLGVMIAWLGTAAVFVGIPVLRMLRADIRAAEAAGLPNPRAVARRRFFLPSRKRALHASLLDRILWVELSTAPVHEKRAMRVTGVRTASLLLEDGTVFEPHSMSRAFPDGKGAAKGVVRTDRGAVPALVIATY